MLLATLCPASVSAAAGPQRALGALPDFFAGNASIAGVVTAASDDKAIQGVSVCAEQPGRAYCVSTNSRGEYLLSGIEGGEYAIEFRDDGAGYVEQYYPDRLSREEAEPIDVPEGTARSGVDAALVQGSNIVGLVKSAGGEPLGEVFACAKLLTAHFERCARSEAGTGSYAIEGLEAGEYVVHFEPDGQNYLSQFYDGKAGEGEATRVRVTQASVTSGIDASLLPGGEIEGAVTEATGGNPVVGADVCITPVGAQSWQDTCTSTTAGGQYAIYPLQSGEYTVTFQGVGDLLTQYYDHRSSAGEADVVDVTAGSTRSGIDAALTRGAKITGVVQDASSRAPVESIEVCARMVKGEGRGCASTNAVGDYTVEGLAPGSYIVEFSTWGHNYLSQYYEDTTDYSEAKAVSVGPEATVSGIDAELQPGAVIEGVVTDAATHQPLSGVEVCADSILIFQFGNDCASTEADGGYSIDKLETGLYRVHFSLSGYASRYYDEAFTSEESQPVLALSGEVASGVNAQLSRGGVISGRVTSAAGNEPLAGAHVCATAQSEIYGCTQTGADGEYSIGGLAAAHYVVSAYGSGYPTQYYGGAFDSHAAQPVEVAAGQTVDPVDLALHDGGSIEGKVRSSVGGAGIAGIQVCAWASGDGDSCTTSAAGGTYEISGLAPAAYRVAFSSGQGYLGASYPGRVAVNAEATATGVEASLQPTARISGEVVEAAHGTALAGITVCAYELEDTYAIEGLYGTCTQTQADGSYVLEGIAAGEWVIGFSGTEALSAQFYPGVGLLEEATPITVSPGGSVPGVDAALGGGGSISGSVGSGPGEPIEGADICVQPAANELSGWHCVTSGPTGAYSISALADGSYRVEFSASKYEEQYYGGGIWPISATLVDVRAGADTGGIDAQLRRGGTMTGKVTSAVTGDPLAGIEVCPQVQPPKGEFPGLPFECTFTGAGGEYRMSSLTPGEYKVSFEDRAHRYSSPSPVIAQLSAEQVLAGVDAHMDPAGSIAGEVLDEAGHPLGGVWVCADASTVASGCVRSGVDGRYAIAGLQPGSYEVSFTAPQWSFEPGLWNYAPQYYPGVARATEAKPVVLGGGDAATGIDARMTAGATISGFITNSADGQPVEEAEVCALGPREGESRLTSCTESGPGGAYAVQGLAAGSYIVEVQPAPPLAERYYGGGALASEATAVPVSAAATVAGIDVTLLAGGSISGKVTSAASGKPIGEVRACATIDGEEARCDRTRVTGNYKIEGLPGGSYDVEFTDEGRYLTQYYDFASVVAEASPVAVGYGAAVANVDARLTPSGPGEVQAPPEGGTPESNTQGGSPSPGGPTPHSGVSGYGVVLAHAPRLAGGIGLHGSSVQLTLRCGSGGGSCLPATVTLSVTEVLSHGRVVAIGANGHLRRGRTTRRVVLATGSFSIAPGGSRRVLLGLDGAGRRLLSRWHSLRLRVVVSAGSVLLGSADLTVRAHRLP